MIFSLLQRARISFSNSHDYSLLHSVSLSLSLHPTMNMPRTNPNIIITGTPAVGKTSHCDVLATNTGLKHLCINQIVKDRGCHECWDEEHKSWIVDEDKVCRIFDFWYVRVNEHVSCSTP